MSSNSDQVSEDELSRWEQMYAPGGTVSNQPYGDFTFDDSGVDVSTTVPSQVRIVSFDLDNTVWKTYGCIDAANDALAKFLDEHKIQQPKRVEVLMKELFQANKSRYSPVLGLNATHATKLTLLRVDAIQTVLEEANGYSTEDARTFAQRAFDIWATARHDAIPDNLATNVIDCLESISKLETSEGHPVLIGAITDGNSDPRRVGMLEKYFDFCVNAEQVGVSKPDRRVYLEAVRQVQSHPSMANILQNLPEDEDDIEIGPYWVHVGDDFVKDIVAAKDLKMRTVWATQLVKEKLKPQCESPTRKVEGRNSDTMKEFMERVSEKPIIQMSIGADDYLMDAFTDEFVDAITEEFHHLSDVVERWHKEGLNAQAALGNTIAAESPPTEAGETSEDLQSSGILSVIMPEIESSKVDPKTNQRIPPRTFRIRRDECVSNVMAPLLDRDSRTMKEVMEIAQLDKASGVFAFAPDDVEGVRIGSKVLMIQIKGTGLEFAREVFAKMSVQEILSFTDQNPVELEMYIKDAASAPSFDLF